MTKPRLPVFAPPKQGLGVPTIMDPALAARHGAPYVHLAAFAIDVDRVRAFLQEQSLDEDLPFGWEVFLTEAFLLSCFDLDDEASRLLVEEACLPLLETRTRQTEPPLGSQLPFAVFDAVERRAAPPTLLEPFRRTWGKHAEALIRELAPLWEDPGPHVAALAELCLDVPLDPPVTEPTARALDELHDAAIGEDASP